ncbi:MAG: hypothetical protein SAK29_09735 [Scytonema sp. PMC 1069.18]|nr:hypothetical protein [Scytonema sp. PMC 1069.18]MEC4886558.1 hypothetical protein [Scytonema sp. PMC 1070.18]
MPKINRVLKKKLKLYRYWIGITLLFNSLFQFVAPVGAEGTKAGESISNTATATYEDPSHPGTTINTTSNTVTVTVAEVAGITVTATGTVLKTDVNADGKVNIGDTVYFNYNVTNVGNDPTRFRIPDQPIVTGSGQIDGKVQISYDSGNTWEDIKTGGTITDSISPAGSVLVRVPVKVADGAANGSTISVKLGDTPGDAQNQLRSENGGDVYTVDNDDGTVQGEVNGTPVNGVREASATQQVTVDSNLKDYTLATVLKTQTGQTSAGVPGPGGDTLSYSLSLRVENNDPTGNGISPAPLSGTSVPGLVGSYILVSDAIPVGTQLTSSKAPTGWQQVYTTSDTSAFDANQATWTTTPPTDLATVRRVGFVSTGAIAPGTTVTGFQISVEVLETPTSITVANIAQLFGQSPSGAPVYDESGDSSPSNFDGSNPPIGTDTNNDKIPDTLPPDVVDDGLIDTTDSDNNGIPDELEGNNGIGVDINNDNSGTGSGGEATLITLNTAALISVLNGPKDAPDAVAENDNNKDFTNKSSFIPAGTTPETTIDPDGVNFTNTVKNTGTSHVNISLLPTTPAIAEHLPTGTIVTLSYGSSSATYRYNGSGFEFLSGQGPVSASNPIRIDGVAPNATANYGVEVNLPSGTPLSTYINRGFPVPITAFIDTDNNGAIASDEPNNITIDRVYTGFLRLLKLSRVLQGNGPTVGTGQDVFETTPGIDADVLNDIARQPAPGNIIEYQIRYKNISEPQSGTGNIILNASNVVITEDGTLSTASGDGKNNWALDNDGNGVIDTSNIVGSAKDSGTATITFFSGQPATNSVGDQTGTTVNTDVTKYIDTVNETVAPGQERTFTFQRTVR